MFKFKFNSIICLIFISLSCVLDAKANAQDVEKNTLEKVYDFCRENIVCIGTGLGLIAGGVVFSQKAESEQPPEKPGLKQRSESNMSEKTGPGSDSESRVDRNIGPPHEDLRQGADPGGMGPLGLAIATGGMGGDGFSVGGQRAAISALPTQFDLAGEEARFRNAIPLPAHVRAAGVTEGRVRDVMGDGLCWARALLFTLVARAAGEPGFAREIEQNMRRAVERIETHRTEINEFLIQAAAARAASNQHVAAARVAYLDSLDFNQIIDEVFGEGGLFHGVGGYNDDAVAYHLNLDPDRNMRFYDFIRMVMLGEMLEGERSPFLTDDDYALRAHSHGLATASEVQLITDRLGLNLDIVSVGHEDYAMRQIPENHVTPGRHALLFVPGHFMILQNPKLALQQD